MKSRYFKIFPVFLLTAALAYFAVQSLLVVADGSQTKEIQQSICRAVEIYLQSGAVREALDYSDSSLKIVRPGRARHVQLREGVVTTDLGAPVATATTYSCKPGGRLDAELVISVSRRPLNESWLPVSLLTLLSLTLLAAIGRWIYLGAQKLTLEFLENELAGVFGVARTAASSTEPILSRVLNVSESSAVQSARVNIAEMKRQLDDQGEQIRSQSVRAALGDLVAHVAHDMRSPLSIISLLSGKMAADEKTDLIGKAVGRLNALADDILKTRKAMIDSSILTDLKQVVIAAASEVKTRTGSTVEIDFVGESISIPGSTEDLTRILVVLLDNSIESIGKSGNIRISGTRSGHEAVLVVEDSGSGFAAEILKLPMGTWTTTKANGNGLGLRFIYSWVNRRGGGLELENRVGGGGRVRLRIPVG